RLMEVVIGLRLLQRGLAILPDQDEGRKEDRFERDHQRQELERVGVGAEETGHDPEREDRYVYPNEGHGAGKRSDLIGEVQLPVARPFPLLVHDHWRVLVIVRSVRRSWFVQVDLEGGHDRSRLLDPDAAPKEAKRADRRPRPDPPCLAPGKGWVASRPRGTTA